MSKLSARLAKAQAALKDHTGGDLPPRLRGVTCVCNLRWPEDMSAPAFTCRDAAGEPVQLSDADARLVFDHDPGPLTMRAVRAHPDDAPREDPPGHITLRPVRHDLTP